MVYRLYLKRCEGGRGLISAKDFVLSECNRLWDYLEEVVNHFSANPRKWSNTPKKIPWQQPKNYLRAFDHFVGLALKGLRRILEKGGKKGYNRRTKRKE